MTSTTEGILTTPLDGPPAAVADAVLRDDR